MLGFWLPYPFDIGFMQHALVAGIAVGVFAPTIGTFLVQKRMSLLGDGIGHIAFAGVGAGIVSGIYPLWTALVFAIVGAIGVEWLRSRRRVSGDLALALFFYSGIALGVVLVSLGGGFDAGVLTYLFGQPLTVDGGEIAAILALGAAIVLVVVGMRRLLFAVVTDEDWSRVAGLPVDAANFVLAALTACAVVAAMRIVGILLVAAMTVLPVASGQLLARSFSGTLWWSVGVGVASAVLGLTASGLWGLVPGGSIVLVAAGFFAIVQFLKGRGGGRALVMEEGT
jgi:zinc transport system permease protein